MILEASFSSPSTKALWVSQSVSYNTKEERPFKFTFPEGEQARTQPASPLCTQFPPDLATGTS